MLSLLIALLLQTEPATQSTTSPTTAARPASFTVAADGSAKYKRITDAINDCPQLTGGDEPFTIFVKPGTYKELLYVQREKRRIRLIGDDPKTTILTYNLTASLPGPDGQKIGTFRTPTALIDADEFTCENLTFENSAAPRTGQALALRIDGDRDVFRNCRFVGYQDTIFGNRGRHYFEHCTIVGAIDFIFGGATEYYEDCEIHCVAPGYIAASSAPEDQPFGLVFDHCRLTAEPGVKTFLGRPWRAYASTAFLHCQIYDIIRDGGWDHWGDNVERERTARYAEYQNTGPGAAADSRVKWIQQLTAEEAAAYERSNVLGGWTPDK